ncbi:hypothetical protein ACQJBY_059135 [Aegilops geniculata]
MLSHGCGWGLVGAPRGVEGRGHARARGSTRRLSGLVSFHTSCRAPCIAKPMDMCRGLRWGRQRRVAAIGFGRCSETMKSLFNDVKHDMVKEDPGMLAPTIVQLEGMRDLVRTSSKAASSLFCSSRGNSFSTILSADDSPTFYGTTRYDSYDHHGASHALVGLRALPLHLWTFETIDHLLHPWCVVAEIHNNCLYT